MLFLLLYALTGDVRAYEPKVHYCDVIEVNRVHARDTGDVRLTQVIFWEWRTALNYKKGRQEWDHYISDWRNLHKTRYTQYYDYARRRHIFHFYDRKDRVYRTVIATSFRETKTLHDIELENRQRLPSDFRSHVLQK